VSPLPRRPDWQASPKGEFGCCRDESRKGNQGQRQHINLKHRRSA
jgi:hypothetical protein